MHTEQSANNIHTNSAVDASDYGTRVLKAFQKLSTLQDSVYDNQQDIFKYHSLAIQEFQQRLNLHLAEKNEKFEAVLNKLRDIQTQTTLQRQRREKAKSDLDKTFSAASKNCIKLLENNRKQRAEGERKMVFQMNAQLDLLTAQVNKKSESPGCIEYLQQVLQEEVVRLKEDVTLETHKRRQVEERIWEEFNSQMGKMREEWERDHQETQAREQQVMRYLNDISSGIKQKVAKLRKDRSATENEALTLIQNIIEKVRTDFSRTHLK